MTPEERQERLALVRDAKNRAYEEAAKVVEGLERDEHPDYYAARIRALKYPRNTPHAPDHSK